MAKFVFRKKENMTISKPMYFAIGLLVVLLIIAILYFIFLKYSPIMNFKYEGYAISGKEITENLLGSSEEKGSSDNKNLELTKIEEQGTIFKKLNDYFVGSKDKTEINLNYPIYINGNSSLYNLSADSTLISKDFEEVSGYPNLSISEGKIYDGNNLERADAKEYIFVKTTDNIYINLYEIKVKTTANEYKIPVNSIIAFNENEIRYYSINNNVLIFNQINDIDNNSNVQMIENNYTYKELLTRLGILQDESNSTVDIEGAQTDIIQENTASENNTNNDEKQNEETDEYTSEDQNGYTKPEVTAENFTAEVYTAKSTLHIKDPSGMIIEAPTFEIYKDGKIYLRRTFSNSGEIQITGLIPDTEYEVIGKYIYLNENNQKVENTFYEGRFTTKGYEELGSIDITKENGEIFSNKIQLTKVKITSDLNAEVLKGINQVEIETGEIRTVLKNSQVNELLQGKEITIESSEGLKSDSKIKYVVKFYDNNGVELKVNNNEGETRTSKEAPTVRVSLKEQDIVNVTLGLKLTNRDNVELENYKYVVTRPNGEVVQENRLSENESELLLEDLDQNQYYKISIYVDYDLNDNRGKQEQVEIGNLVFATQPISTLGSLELTVENKELTSTTSTISYKINEDRTDKRLIQILNELTINIKDGENIVKTDTLTEEEITNLQQAGTKEIKYENLKSNTTYTIEITGNVQLGNTQEEIPITYNYKEFTTLKIPAKVEIRNQFVTGNLIDFDVRIEDINNAVLNNTVRMELRNSSNDLIDLQELTTNEDYIRKTYEKLEENQTYTLRFYADQYNEGSTDETYKVNYLIKEIEIITEPGISGSIGLTELSKKAIGKNLVDVSSDIKWYVYPNFNTYEYYGKEYDEETKILKLGRNNNSRRAVYDLREYAGQEVTMSFKARTVVSESSDVYIQNSKTDNRNRTKIEGLTTDWKEFQYTLTVDKTGYLGFYVHGGNGIEIKELQVEIGNQKTSYEEYKYTLQSRYSINLEDRRDEITTNDYYIKIYEDNNLVKTDRYEEIPEENVITNAIKTYETQTKKQYNVELAVKIKDREYVLSELEYNTNDTEEIKGIYNKEDFLEIQPRGHYIVLGDIDLTGSSGNQYKFGSNNMPFYGKIDFNGHKLIRDAKSTSSIIYKLGENGILENVVLDIYINNSIEIKDFTGLIYNNYGNVRNIKINLKECTNHPNKTICFVAFNNYNLIENFIVNLEKNLYIDQNLGLIAFNNMEIIKNGYIYGNDIIVTNYTTANKNIGGITCNNYKGGSIENVYNLINIKLIEEKKDGTVANIISLHRFNSIAKNCYSVGLIENDNISSYGPVIGDMYGGSTTENIYYFYGETKNNTYNTKTTPLALWDTNFQNQILNSDNAFNVDELVEQGYYPQVKMPACMPNQEYIELPEVENKDLADILSTEVQEQGSNTAKVKFVINNPSSETITNIKIQNLDCTIESQEYNDGQSIVIATLDDPVICTSNYSVQSITTKGAFSQEYTRNFNNNERTIPVELYKEIKTIDDWIAINNSPTENYILMNDLDFTNQGDNIRITKAYTGKFEGNNYKLKNIKVTSGLFSSVTGKIQNIEIENITITKGGSENIGIITNTNNANIANITVQNENILLNEGNNMTVYAGGLIGYMLSTNIQNVSVTDLSVNVDDSNSSFAIGGLIGYVGDYNVIKNSFVQDININENASFRVLGIGGIIGTIAQTDQYKSIENCYVVGNIKTTRGNIGGLIGSAENTEVKNCISYVNIIAEQNNIGGIIGQETRTAQFSENILEDNLTLGNLYSNSINTNEINRIIGNREDTENNYAYKNQLINGHVTNENLGGKLISYEEIFKESTYTTKMNFENQYDLTELQNEILPKLLNTEGKLLPNQKDNTLEKEQVLEIENIEAQKTGTNTLQARIDLINTSEVTINKIIIDGIDTEITRNETQNGKTYIDIKGTVTKYFDNYRIEKIEYTNDNEETKEVEVNGKIELQYFKEIHNFEDWQSIDESSYQNYRLLSDIDFSGKTNIKDNILVNRLETDGTVYTLKNINLEYTTSYNGLIKDLKNTLENINFENITINNSTSNSSYIGVIVNSNATTIQNIKIKNVKINVKGNYIGFISNAEGESIANVNIDTANIIGNTYIGTFAGNIRVKNIDNIYCTNITINATGSHIGGIFGYIQNVEKGHMKNVTIENNSIIQSTYNGDQARVGGIVGYKIGNSSYYIGPLYAKNITVKGKNYVGGIGGSLTDAKELYADNVTVIGNDHVGGIQGAGGSIYNVYIKNSTIKGTGDYVGGVSGTTDWAYYYIEAVNTKIQSTGNYLGAIAGVFGTNITSFEMYAKDCIVEGNSYVGGITGKYTKGSLYKTYNNSKVTATNHTAGGIIGYLDNTNMTAVNNTSKLYNNYVAGGTITAKINAGGFIGNITEDLYMPDTYYYSNYIEAYVDCDDDSTSSLGIGGRENQNQYLKDTYYYKYSTINGENPTAQNEVFIPQENYLTEAELKEQTTYTSKLKWTTTNWKFDVLQNNKYPTINSSNLPDQEGIDLPKDEEHNLSENTNTQSLNNAEDETLQMPEQTFEYAGKQITTYSDYSIIQDAEGNSVKRNTKLYLKDGNLFALSPTIDMVDGNFIIDNYNGKEYETVLGTDGKMYDLKEKVTYPENFKNEDIKSIGNNLNTDEKEVEVTYNNGDKIKFNYQTGEVISEEKLDENKTGLVEFIQDKLQTEESVITTNEEGYENTKELIQKLQEVPVEKAEEIQSNSEKQENQTEEQNENSANYITTYNVNNDRYEIYNEEDLLSTTKQTVETENEKIEKNNLSGFYLAQISKAPEESGKTAIYVIIAVVIIILTLLFRYNVKKNKKNR